MQSSSLADSFNHEVYGKLPGKMGYISTDTIEQAKSSSDVSSLISMLFSGNVEAGKSGKISYSGEINGLEGEHGSYITVDPIKIDNETFEWVDTLTNSVKTALKNWTGEDEPL